MQFIFLNSCLPILGLQPGGRAAIRQYRKYHNYLVVLPPKKRICSTIVSFSFSLDLESPQEKMTTMVMQFFFLGGGGGMLVINTTNQAMKNLHGNGVKFPEEKNTFIPVITNMAALTSRANQQFRPRDLLGPPCPLLKEHFKAGKL